MRMRRENVADAGRRLERRSDDDIVLESLAISLRASGHSVLASGTTLSLCW